MNIKWINSSLKHRDITYSVGDVYSDTGIYYTSIEDAFRWIDYSDPKGFLALIEPLGVIVDQETKSKADGIRIKELLPLEQGIEYLLDRKADPRVYHHHPLIVACAWGKLDLVKRFIAAGCNPATRVYGPVVVAAAEGHLDIVKYLAKLGSDLCTNNNEALRLAAEGGHLKVVQYLVQNGAKTGWDESIVQAASRGHTPIVQFFYELGAKKLEDAMWWAIARNNRKVAKFLVSKGVPIKIHRPYFEHRQDQEALAIIDSL